jgi:hypothetical protein
MMTSTETAMANRHYLHGDYLELPDRSPGSTVYCGLCDGYCGPEHLYNDHEIEESIRRLNAGRKALTRARQTIRRPEGAANYFDGTPDPC